MSWYAAEPRNLTRADVQHEIRDFVQSQSLRGSMVPRSIPQITVDIPVVTALPLGAQDGSEVYFIADSDNGVIWHLRYRRNGSPDYPWEYVGGAPIYSEVTTPESTASGTFTDLATVGPTITIPALVKGDFDITLGCTAWNNTTGQAFYMSYSIAGVGASASDAIFMQEASGGNTRPTSEVRTRRKTGLAPQTLTAKYQANGGTATFQDRYMSATPVRVGRA